ncbi:MAG TPA: acyl-CoA dehydrogenase family protein [Acidimicrobiales bacterium]|nr:acyl-CoA dehydrogenase family protein [Acidimicrobiales bacterium]
MASTWAGLDVEQFRVAAADWLARHSAGAPGDYGAIVPEAQLGPARAWQRSLARAGLVGLHWPPAWGGQGLTPGHTAAWLEECARAGVPPFLNMVGLVLTAEALLAYGTDDQRATHLPALRTGERLWCQLFSEPDAGSDLAAVRTRARRSGDGWVLEGEKVWTSNGHVADWGICLARTDPVGRAHAGLSFFLVDMRAPGVEVRPIRQITGAAEFDQVAFGAVHLPAAGLLGEEGAGWRVAMSTLTHERTHIGASAVRLRLRADGMAADLATATVGPVGADRAAGQWAASRALAALGAQQERLGPAAASLMKLGVARQTVAASRAAADRSAAALLDGPAAAELLGAVAGEIAGGTTQVQKTIIGERLLGLPREPAPAGR